MERYELLNQIWNWLPAFRAVAETQHLPTASQQLHVTASALSRTIALIEDRVGQALFSRSGRQIILNPAGEKLLHSVRAAERNMDDGLVSLAGDPMRGPVHVSTLGVLSNQYVLPALIELKRRHPDLVPVVNVHRASEADDLLSRGLLDIAFYYDATGRDDLNVERIGISSNSIYCGRTHPLFGEQPSARQILEYEFSVPKIGDRGLPMDTWPVELQRRVGMRIELLASNLELCRSGLLLTVLPDVLALECLQRGELHRLTAINVPPVVLFGASRRREAPDGRVARIRQLVADSIAHVNADLLLHPAFQEAAEVRRPRKRAPRAAAKSSALSTVVAPVVSAKNKTKRAAGSRRHAH